MKKRSVIHSRYESLFISLWLIRYSDECIYRYFFSQSKCFKYDLLSSQKLIRKISQIIFSRFFSWVKSLWCYQILYHVDRDLLTSNKHCKSLLNSARLFIAQSKIDSWKMNFDIRSIACSVIFHFLNVGGSNLLGQSICHYNKDCGNKYDLCIRGKCKTVYKLSSNSPRYVILIIKLCKSKFIKAILISIWYNDKIMINDKFV